MTKKDYELIAKVVEGNFRAFKMFNVHPSHWQDLLASEFANELAKDNPRFDRNKFLKACGIESYNVSNELEIATTEEQL